MLPSDKHIWFSVSKIFVSTAVAILEDGGMIDVGKPIDAYLAELAGTAWSGIPIVDILDMASGIDCPEVKSDPDSCFWEFYDAFGWPITTRAQDDAMATVPAMGTLRPSGEVFDYTSVNTEVLNHLVEVVSGERFSDFVEREIWQRAEPESDALIGTTPNGAAFSAGGVSSNLRDLARFGMLFTDGVRAEGDPAISDAYMEKIQRSGRPELTPADLRETRSAQLGDDSFRHNSYQWDIVTTDGHFFKSGFGGQGLYVSPSQDLVIAWFGTQDDRGGTEMLGIARQLATSGIF
jgi:CubicO group peptidase (beta-lactamase class C family)